MGLLVILCLSNKGSMIDVLVTVLVLTTSDINVLVRELDEIASDYLATGFAYVYFEPVSMELTKKLFLLD